MTDQKRDESTKRYPPIQQDPARRIRRIRRLKMLPGERFTEAMGCVVCSTLRAETMTEYKRRRLREMRLAKVATLANQELDWLCKRSAQTERGIVSVYAELDSVSEILHRSGLRAITERGVLNDVKVWASEQLRASEQTIAEQKARIDALTGNATPYPLSEVLRILADSADHLLRDHSCDAHGYELVGTARDYARKMIEALKGPNQ